ncbi:transmembrane protein 220 isoform X1 [Poecilia reticulata]|uniref:transmembrane protein 220 isoform X1 n=1 Tax=Poecilia reticulata TaxID=8081 RepID=UPI0004A2199E|nr:PREDICTED: transmembrane protein 220 isoform X1 [Poecilia reticulata]
MGEVCEKISWLSVVWRLSNVLMSVFFTLASYVQINDPDAGLWVVGYAVPAVLCVFIGFRPQVTGRRRVSHMAQKLHPLSCFALLRRSHWTLHRYRTCISCNSATSWQTWWHHSWVCLWCLTPETSPWRRVADLHLLSSSAAVFMLGWKLYAERVTQIFQQEEGREFSGLTLTAVWLLLCRRSGSAPVGKLRVSTAVAITVFPIVAWLYYHINEELRSDWPSHCKTAL